jgi:hypothetical protein
LKAYPFLKEPMALDLLREALEIMDVRIPRLKRQLYNPNTEPGKIIALEKIIDSLQRTLVLYFTRLGITYTSRQRRKEPHKVKTPLEMIEKEE